MSTKALMIIESDDLQIAIEYEPIAGNRVVKIARISIPISLHINSNTYKLINTLPYTVETNDTHHVLTLDELVASWNELQKLSRDMSDALQSDTHNISKQHWLGAYHIPGIKQLARAIHSLEAT